MGGLWQTSNDDLAICPHLRRIPAAGFIATKIIQKYLQVYQGRRR